MTEKEAISHIEYIIKAYQNLIDNDARNGEVIDKDIKGEWESEKTLAGAYMIMIESLKMAIQALEQEPKTDKDYISRKAVIDVLTKNGVHFYNMVNITSDLKELPSAIPKEPKTDVLDEIKAEIEETVLESLSDGGDDWFTAEKVNECLEIIDKYRQEG